MHQLAYSRPPALAWVARRRRLLICLALALAVALPLYRYRQPLVTRVAWLYWSHRCATHRMPDDVELIVVEPGRAQRLLASDPDYVPLAAPPGTVVRRATSSTQPAPTPVAVYCPRVWRKLASVDGRCDWLCDWFGTQAIAFLGTMHRPDGASRLVIFRGADTNALDLLGGMRLLVLPHPKLYDSVPGHVISGGYAYSGRYEPARLHGGNVDVHDASHLVLRFDAFDGWGPNAKRISGVIDGYLQNDDSIRFVVRQSPELRTAKVLPQRTSISGLIPQFFIDESRKLWGPHGIIRK